MVGSGLTRITPERPGEIRPFRQRDNAADEFSDVTWRAKDGALQRDGRARGRLVWRQRPPPSAMYSNTLVGDPKNVLSIMCVLCGET